MSSRRTFAYVLGTLTAAVVAAMPLGAFPPGPNFEITKFTIDSGGGTSVGGVFELQGTIGQQDAHTVLTGGVFEVSGGFWGYSEAPPPCPWDLNGDGTVGIGDLLALFSEWGPCPGQPGPPECPGDFNADGSVGVADLLIMFANWGPCS